MMVAAEVIGEGAVTNWHAAFANTLKNQRQAGRRIKGLLALNKNVNIEGREKEKTSPTSEFTTSQEGKENKLMA